MNVPNGKSKVQCYKEQYYTGTLNVRPMNSKKRPKGMTAEDEPPRLEGVQYAIGEEQRTMTNSSRKNKMAGPKWK